VRFTEEEQETAAAQSVDESPKDAEDIEAPLPTEQLLFKTQLDKYFDGSVLSPITKPTRGMRYIEHKQTHLAKAGSFKKLSDNLSLLKHMGAPTVLVVYLFGGARRVMETPRGEVFVEVSPDSETESAISEISKFVKRPFKVADFFDQMRPFCRDPRIRSRSSPTQPKPKWAKVSKRLSQKASEGELQHIRGTVEFLELAGLNRGLISQLVGETCRVLFPHGTSP